MRCMLMLQRRKLLILVCLSVPHCRRKRNETEAWHFVRQGIADPLTAMSLLDGDPQTGREWQVPPRSWTSQTEPIQVFPVEQGTAEYAEVSRAFYASLSKERDGVVTLGEKEDPEPTALA